MASTTVASTTVASTTVASTSPKLELREEQGSDHRDDLLCTNLTVSGDYQTEFSGSYIISDEKASYSPNKPVYKLEGQNKYIYYYPNSGGWRIAEEGLVGENEGSHYYISKPLFTI